MKRLFFCAFFLMLASIYAESIRYFAGRNENFGVPDGLFELSQKQAERGSHYVFHYDKSNRVVRIVSRKYRTVTEDVFNLRTVEFEYNPAGQLVKRIFKNPEGKIELIWNYPAGPDCIVFSNPYMFDHKSNDFIPFPDDFLQDETGADMENTLCGKIGGLRLFRDKKGRVTRIQYRKDNDTAIGSDVFRTCGQEYELDDHGRFLRVHLLDRNGKRKADAWGVASYRLTYQGPWNAMLETFALSGKPINCNRGFAVQKNEVNADGNTVKDSFFGADGKPVMDRASRVSVNVIEYDAKTAMPVHKMNYGTDEKPCTDVNGSFSSDVKCDEKGRIAEIILHSIDNLPLDAKYNIPGEIVRYSYDAMDRVVRTQWYAADNAELIFSEETDPVPVNGVQTSVTRNAMGDVLIKSIKKFDSNGTLMSKKNLYAEEETPKTIHFRYDKYGTLLERFQVFEGGFRRELDSDGIVVKEFDLNKARQIISGKEIVCDERGCLKSMRFLKPDQSDFVYTQNRIGVWEIRFLMEERGNETEQAYFDLSGNPMGRKNGEEKPIFRIKTEYDSRGNPIFLEYFQENGESVMSESNGYASSQADYDSRDNQIAICWFTPDMRPFPHPFFDKDEDEELENLPATVRKTFDAADRIMEINLFAAEAQGTLYGIRDASRIKHRTVRTAEGEIITTCAYDADDKPLRLGKNIYFIRIGSDTNGKTFYHEFLDENEKSVMSEAAGFASFRTIDGVRHYYDAGGKEIPPPKISQQNKEEDNDESENYDD